MMKYRAKCTFCISQVMNTYPNRQKNPMPKDDLDTYIEVDTKEEADCIEAINRNIQTAYIMLSILEHIIENK